MLLMKKNLFVLRASTWSYIGWALLYAGLWLYPLRGGTVPEEFAEILAADYLINMGTPFVIGAGFLIYATVIARTGKRLGWYAWPALAAVAFLGIGIPFMVMFQAGGWMLLAFTVLFFARAGWFSYAHGDSAGLIFLFFRGLVAPWLFMAPALLISSTVVGRDTIGFDNTDWVPLFGFIYFGMQAAFEEFMLRKIAPGPSA